MHVLKQRHPHTCGQTCVAMVADVTYERALEAVGRGIAATSGQDLIRGLRALGVSTVPRSVRNTMNRMPVPRRAILRIKSWQDKRWPGHWVLRLEDYILDPEDGEWTTLAWYLKFRIGEAKKRITSYVEIC